MYQTITTNVMVNNVKETIDFYHVVLGFEVILTVPGTNEEFQFAIIQKDSISLMLQSKKTLIEEYESLATDTIKPSFTLYITVDDVEKQYEKLRNKATLAKELHKTFYGKPEFAIFDNNGNILTISC